MAKVDELEGVIKDLNQNKNKVMTNPESKYDELWEVLTKKLDYISKYLGNKEFL